MVRKVEELKFYVEPTQETHHLKNTQPVTNGPDLINFHLTKDVNAQTDANPSDANDNNYTDPFAILNNVMYFSADDGIHGTELWRSDGTAAGTFMVKDIETGDNASSPF